MLITFTMRYDSHSLRGRLLPITLERSISCRLHLLSGQRTPTDARQRHHIRYLYNHPVRRSIRGRSRVRCTLYRWPIRRWPAYYLSRLGYPQPPTTILCDNTTAIGLANDNIKMKRSKAIDMRFHWIRDRVRQNQFYLVYIPTKENIADYMTKNLPKDIHDRFIFYLVRDTTDAATKCLIAQRRL